MPGFRVAREPRRTKNGVTKPRMRTGLEASVFAERFLPQAVRIRACTRNSSMEPVGNCFDLRRIYAVFLGLGGLCQPLLELRQVQADVVQIAADGCHRCLVSDEMPGVPIGKQRHRPAPQDDR